MKIPSLTREEVARLVAQKAIVLAPPGHAIPPRHKLHPHTQSLAELHRAKQEQRKRSGATLQ